MKPIRSSLLVLATVLLATAATAANREPAAKGAALPDPIIDGQGVLITSSTSSANALVARETAGSDTFILYGGPDRRAEGKFQLVDGVTADWGGGNGLPGGRYGGGPNAWAPVDSGHISV